MPDRLKEELADFWGEKKMQDRIAQLESENKRLREALRWQNVELRERIARALHRHECETTTLYVQGIEIDNAWAADGANRKLWHEKARVVLEEIEQALKEP